MAPCAAVSAYLYTAHYVGTPLCVVVVVLSLLGLLRIMLSMSFFLAAIAADASRASVYEDAARQK